MIISNSDLLLAVHLVMHRIAKIADAILLENATIVSSAHNNLPVIAIKNNALKREPRAILHGALFVFS